MNMTRFLVRLEAHHKWNERRSWAAMCDIEELIGKAIKDGVFEQGDATRVGKNVLRVGVHPAHPPTPRNGFQAKRASFMLEGNPFPQGTDLHRRWARSWSQIDWSDIRR